MVDPSTDEDSEVPEGCREIWTTQGVQEANTKKGNNVFNIVQVGPVRDDNTKFKNQWDARILPSLLKQNDVLMDVRVGWVSFG